MRFPDGKELPDDAFFEPFGYQPFLVNDIFVLADDIAAEDGIFLRRIEDDDQT
jgi:hypothetical protein